MYYLNSDGTMDEMIRPPTPAPAPVATPVHSTGDDEEFRGCNCNTCSRKRKRRHYYPSWLTCVNIVLVLLLLGTIYILFSNSKLFSSSSNSSSGRSISKKLNIGSDDGLIPNNIMNIQEDGGGEFEMPLL
jgi:hypothetical protein